MIGWGMVCLIGYPVAQFMSTPQLYKWAFLIWGILLLIGLSVSIISGVRVSRREKREGLISHLSKQIGWIWCILVINAAIWNVIGLFRDPFGGPGFLWAAIYGFALSIMGILHSKEWLFGGIAIFIAILFAYEHVIIAVIVYVREGGLAIRSDIY